MLDHVVVLGERHLRHLLLSYMTYYNEARTHLSLNKDAPISREVKASDGSSQSHISADCITSTFGSDYDKDSRAGSATSPRSSAKVDMSSWAVQAAESSHRHYR